MYLHSWNASSFPIVQKYSVFITPSSKPGKYPCLSNSVLLCRFSVCSFPVQSMITFMTSSGFGKLPAEPHKTLCNRFWSSKSARSLLIVTSLMTLPFKNCYFYKEVTNFTFHGSLNFSACVYPEQTKC